MIALFDVNVLVALFDAAHVHHAPAQAWLKRHRSRGWATCPITQNGCVRVPNAAAIPWGSARHKDRPPAPRCDGRAGPHILAGLDLRV